MAVWEHLERLIENYPALGVCRAEIKGAFEILKDTYDRQGMLLVCGNGGRIPSILWGS